MTTEEIQALIGDAKCLECKIPPGMVPYATLAVLLDLANGDTPPTDPDEIMAEASCLTCIPAGMVPYAILETIRNLP
jgi:hypothetical protein